MRLQGEKMAGITFQAILNAIRTTVDGGWRVSFDIPQSEAEAIMQLAGKRDENLQVAVVTSMDILNRYDSGRDS
jgi:hypothetical protein